MKGSTLASVFNGAIFGMLLLKSGLFNSENFGTCLLFILANSVTMALYAHLRLQEAVADAKAAADAEKAKVSEEG